MRASAYRMVYLHRLEFSGSSQTIQVLRDYHALLRNECELELFYRARAPLPAAEIAEWLDRHGLAPSGDLRLHWIRESLGGKRRLERAAAASVAASTRPVFISVRTMDHARIAFRLRQRYGRRRVRVVIELHETGIPHLVYREQGRHFKSWFSRQTESFVLRSVDGIVATVGSQLELLDRHFPEHAACALLPNGVDLQAFAAPAPTRPSDDRFHLRYAGQFLPWKGTDTMVEALVKLPQEVVLDLAGGKPDTEDTTRNAILALARRFGVTERVRYLGFLSPRDVPSFLMQANALLLPLGLNVQSRYLTCPMKLFEYAASGVPMVVARQPTTLSLVQDGEQALMFAPGSAPELAAAVARLRTDPKLGETLAARAKSWVRQYSYEQRAARFRNFLDTIHAR